MYFPNINLLRAFAALLVLVYHVIELGPWPDFPSSGPLLTFRAGWVGVDLFFVISGFVIGLSAIRLYRDGDSDYRRTFMRRRLARIVPLYLVTCVAFLILVQPAVLSLPWPKLLVQFASHLLFLHNLHPALHGAINGPNWSVAALFLMAASLLNLIILASSLGLGSLLLRLVNSP
jgi:peptidoglycan/LPS O-acetylase OafA/YrhL